MAALAALVPIRAGVVAEERGVVFVTHSGGFCGEHGFVGVIAQSTGDLLELGLVLGLGWGLGL